MKSEEEWIEVRAKLYKLSTEYEQVKIEIKKINQRAVQERDKLLTRGIEVQGALKFMREAMGLEPTPLDKDEVETYIKKNKDDVYREILKQFVLDNLKDNLLAVELIDKYNLNEPDRERTMQVEALVKWETDDKEI